MVQNHSLEKASITRSHVRCLSVNQRSMESSWLWFLSPAACGAEILAKRTERAKKMIREDNKTCS